jgi:hypothetical protein
MYGGALTKRSDAVNKTSLWVRNGVCGSPETMVSNDLSVRNILITIERLARRNCPKHQNIHRSTDSQLDRLADTAEHFHSRIDGELGGFLIHHVGHTRARDHQNLGGLGLL